MRDLPEFSSGLPRESLRSPTPGPSGACSSTTDFGSLDEPTPAGFRKPRKGRWTSANDERLLLEVENGNPWAEVNESAGWVKVTKVMNQLIPGITMRAVKDRCKELIGFYETENKKQLKSSGTEEEYDAKIQILESIVELRAIKRMSPNSKRKALDERRGGEAMRQIRKETLDDELMSQLDDEEHVQRMSNSKKKRIQDDLMTKLYIENLQKKHDMHRAHMDQKLLDWQHRQQQQQNAMENARAERDLARERMRNDTENARADRDLMREQMQKQTEAHQEMLRALMQVITAVAPTKNSN